jgi:hypothetical protein
MFVEIRLLLVRHCTAKADLAEIIEKTVGLGTGLNKENRKSSAPVGSPELECFLKQLEEELLKQSIDEVEKNNKSEHANSKGETGFMLTYSHEYKNI